MIQYQNGHVTVFQSELYKTTSTVVQTEDCIIIVDPNWLPSEVKTIRKFVDNIKDSRPLYILFTHSDWDHIIGYGAFPDSTVIASATFSKHPEKATILEEINTFDDTYYLNRNYPIGYPKVDITVEKDGQLLSIGKTNITFYLANGHTNDGIYAIIEPLGIWIAGDYLSDLEFPFIYDSSAAYLTTLAKTTTILNDHNITMLVPGHGTYTNDNTEIISRTNEAINYITALKKAIRSNTNSYYLIEKYSYVRSMSKAHGANLKLLKSELD